ncbi:hypothetical protein CEXT_530001 [Caerostris extrusa]|uniref:Uncharacterized protein n=1 Tax=Caerostris extrusa TaxID=172846 RepID=A0AAV4QAW2_CAEEX|nr:hypothetical protein CEXT_530001 [Caerostris extrusa]
MFEEVTFHLKHSSPNEVGGSHANTSARNAKRKLTLFSGRAFELQRFSLRFLTGERCMQSGVISVLGSYFKSTFRAELNNK